MKKSAIITAIALLVIAIFSGVGFWQWKKEKNAAQWHKTQNQTQRQEQQGQQQASETDSWQTFNGAKLGIEIKYPPGYFAKLGDEKVTFDPSFFISNPSLSETGGIINNYVLELNMTPNFIGGNDGRIKTPDEWFAIQKKPADNYVKTTVAGQLAFVKDNKLGKIDLRQYVIFINNGIMYDAYQIIIRKDDVGEKIISTLKFTK